MKATLTGHNCCKPATLETTIQTKDVLSKPRLRAVRSSPSNYNRCSPRSYSTRYAKPVKFMVPKPRPRATSSLGELGHRAVSKFQDKGGVPEPHQNLCSFGLEVKGRKSIESEKADFNREKLCLNDTAAYELDDEEKNPGVSRQHRHSLTADVSSMVERFGVKRKGRLSVRSRPLRKGQRAKSALIRPAKSSLIRASSSSNTPLSGSIKKEFHIGSKSFTAASFLEKKFYL